MNTWIILWLHFIGVFAVSSKGNSKLIASSLYPEDIDGDATLDVIPLIKKYGYPAESHSVITKDGYILDVHRIPHGRDQNNYAYSHRPTVLLMHGLMSSSADWVIMGPSKGLAYILAEAGYDVWMGNARGNFYSRKHTTLNPDGFSKRKYWDFSWHEIGTRDLPSTIDYILSKTGERAIHYIGHSQGNTAFFVMASLLPEYNEKIIAMQALAPLAYMTNIQSLLYKILAPLSSPHQFKTSVLGLNEFLPNTQIMAWAGRVLCYKRSLIKELCENIAFLMAGSNASNLNVTIAPIIMGHSPAGASAKQLAHYGQLINSGEFQQWDFGSVQNLGTYGTWNPPKYSLANIDTPVALHYSEHDPNTNVKDVTKLSQELGKSLGLFQVQYPGFSHTDFVWSMQAKSAVYQLMINIMASYN